MGLSGKAVRNTGAALAALVVLAACDTATVVATALPQGAGGSYSVLPPGELSVSFRGQTLTGAINQPGIGGPANARLTEAGYLELISEERQGATLRSLAFALEWPGGYLPDQGPALIDAGVSLIGPDTDTAWVAVTAPSDFVLVIGPEVTPLEVAVGNRASFRQISGQFRITLCRDGDATPAGDCDVATVRFETPAEVDPALVPGG
jgi:hypothetical protein